MRIRRKALRPRRQRKRAVSVRTYCRRKAKRLGFSPNRTKSGGELPF